MTSFYGVQVPYQRFLTFSDSSTSVVTPSYISREWLHLQSRATGPTSHQTIQQNKQNNTKKTAKATSVQYVRVQRPYTNHRDESMRGNNVRILIASAGWFEKSPVYSPWPSHLPPSRPMSSRQTASERWLDGRHKRMRGESSEKHQGSRCVRDRLVNLGSSKIAIYLYRVVGYLAVVFVWKIGKQLKVQQRGRDKEATLFLIEQTNAD